MKSESGFPYFIAKKLVLLLAVILFFNCQSDEKRIMIWHYRRPVERELMREVLGEFKKRHYPDWTFEERFYEPEELRTNFIIAALAGSGPAMILGPNDNIGPLVDLEVIQPIEPYVDEAFLDQFVKEPFSANTWYRGHLYQIADQVGNHLCLIYNKDIVPEPPETINELIALKEEISEHPDGTERYVLAWNFIEPFFFIPFIGGYGGWIMDEDNNPTLNTEPVIKAAQLIYDLRNKYEIIPKEADYEFANQLFKDGYAAMMINGPWSFSTYTDRGMNIGITRIPKIDETGLWPRPMISPLGYSLNANLKGEKLQVTVELLKYLTSKEIELRYTELTGAIPSRKDALDSEIVRNNEILQSSVYQLNVGRPMPVVTELRWIWDAMRPSYQAIFTGEKTPREAAKEMQALAEKLIRESK
jgi:maltose-binding protein MalE